ncbi:MAG: hypothetical protein LBD91_07040 [Prevotellaceae bacterium]|jgi:hypothetical protein|nr:hypothetical protein [Prevotellaceae bacterium]
MNAEISEWQGFFEMPQYFFEIPPYTSEIPQKLSEIPQCFSETPQCFSEIPQYFSEIPQCFSEIPQCFSEIPQCFMEAPHSDTKPTPDYPTPTDWEELINSSFATRSPMRMTFSGHDRGTRLFLAARWENNRGEKGPWTEIFSAIVP